MSKIDSNEISKTRTSLLAEWPSSLSAQSYIRGAAAALLKDQQQRIQKLESEIARRDINEARNCLNWGPCSQHDGRMANLGDTMEPEQ